MKQIPFDFAGTVIVGNNLVLSAEASTSFIVIMGFLLAVSE